CRPPYEGDDAHKPRQHGPACLEATTWAAHPHANLCCRYDRNCAAPASWASFATEADCRSYVDRWACEPGESRYLDSCGNYRVCGAYRTFREDNKECDARADGKWLGFRWIRFAARAVEVGADGLRQLDRLAGELIAYRATDVSISALASAREVDTDRDARALATRRGAAIADV